MRTVRRIPRGVLPRDPQSCILCDGVQSVRRAVRHQLIVYVCISNGLARRMSGRLPQVEALVLSKLEELANTGFSATAVEVGGLEAGCLRLLRLSPPPHEAMKREAALRVRFSFPHLPTHTLQTSPPAQPPARRPQAAVNTIEFSLRENNTGSFPRGLSLMLRAVGAWIYDQDPFQQLQVRRSAGGGGSGDGGWW